MKRVIIVTAFSSEQLIDQYRHYPFIAVEGGVEKLTKKGIVPFKVIGDFDSYDLLNVYQVVKKDQVTILSSNKDYSDTEMAIILAQKLNFDEVIILNDFNGRFDHVYSLVLCLKKYYPLKVFLEDDHNRLRYWPNGEYRLKKGNYRYFGIFAFPKANITLASVAYPLKEREINFDETLVLSNEIEGEWASIIVESGGVLLIESRD